jgi:hypothetical protein
MTVLLSNRYNSTNSVISSRRRFVASDISQALFLKHEQGAFKQPKVPDSVTQLAGFRMMFVNRP